MAALLLPVLSACQAGLQSRRELAPTFSAERGRPAVRSTGSRLRFDEFLLAGLQASAATRRWPLHDGQTTSHRYTFELRERDQRRRQVSCLLLTITGDADGGASRLECAMEADELARDASWSLRVRMDPWASGTLTGELGGYEVRRADRHEMLRASDDARAIGVVVHDGHAPVAAVQLNGRRSVWIDAGLNGIQRSAVAATLFAIIVGHELGASS